jgi:heptosyltransferase II
LSDRAAVRRLSEGAAGRILVVQMGYLGDVVFTSPLVGALRSRFPNATILFSATPKGSEIARCIPGVDAVVPFDKRGADWGLAWLRVGRQLRPIDIAVVAHTSPRSALLALACSPAVVVGMRSVLGAAFFDSVEPWDLGVSYPERHLRLARALGAHGESNLRLQIPAGAEKAEGELRGRSAVGFIFGSEWSTKRWAPERYGALAGLLAARGWTSVLIGASHERRLADDMRRAMPRSDSVIDCVGWSVTESLGLLARCRAVVGGDTGLVHAARALGVPSVVLFGPTDPNAHIFERTTWAVRVGVPCQPCHEHGPERCPLGHHDCMKKLAVDQVAQAVVTALEGTAP